MRRGGGILVAGALFGLVMQVRADEDSSSDIDWLVHVTRSMPQQVHGHVHREQSLATDDLGVWVQVATADASMAYAATSEGMAGITLENALDRKGDGFGLGGGWSTPISDTLRTQGVIESDHRLQVTGSLQVTFDAQLLIPPGSTQVSDVILAGAIRAKFEF